MRTSERISITIWIIENITRLQEVLMLSAPEQRNVWIAFLDVIKAFDNIEHDHLKRILRENHADSKDIAINCFCYVWRSRHKSGSWTTTGVVPVKRGVLQGGPLSHLLFNICKDFILKDLNVPIIQAGFGFTIGNSMSLCMFAFADDLVVVTNNRQAAASLINSIIAKLRLLAWRLARKSQSFLMRNALAAWD